MIELSNGTLIKTDILSILYDLRRDLFIHNINKLKDIIIKGPNALITCPQHKGGMESHPSCYVRLTENDSIKEGVVHCFTCGYKCDIKVLISNCFGYEDQGIFGEKWLSSHYEYAYLSDQRMLNHIGTKKETSSVSSFVSPEELASYRFYHPYMFERKLTEEIINKFDIGYDKKLNAITFPVYDKNNNCLFVVKRNVDFKKFYIPKNIDKGIFGLNQLPKDCKEVCVCESVFNALTCWVYGYPAIALFGTGSKHQYEQLKETSIRRYILCFDGDNAGAKGARRFKENLGNDVLTITLNVPLGKDINDLSKEEFEKIYKKAVNQI